MAVSLKAISYCFGTPGNDEVITWFTALDASNGKRDEHAIGGCKLSNREGRYSRVGRQHVDIFIALGIIDPMKVKHRDKRKGVGRKEDPLNQHLVKSHQQQKKLTSHRSRNQKLQAGDGS